MIHWIDDMWNLRVRVLVVKELRKSHGGACMKKVLHEVHVHYNFTEKVIIFLCLFTFVY